eukprot:5112499-Pleurochrysis_carterae.AAC.1
MTTIVSALNTALCLGSATASGAGTTFPAASHTALRAHPFQQERHPRHHPRLCRLCCRRRRRRR